MDGAVGMALLWPSELYVGAHRVPIELRMSEQAVEKPGTLHLGLGHLHPDDAFAVFAYGASTGKNAAAAIDAQDKITLDGHAVVSDVEPMAVNLLIGESARFRPLLRPRLAIEMVLAPGNANCGILVIHVQLPVTILSGHILDLRPVVWRTRLNLCEDRKVVHGWNLTRTSRISPGLRESGLYTFLHHILNRRTSFGNNGRPTRGLATGAVLKTVGAARPVSVRSRRLPRNPTGSQLNGNRSAEMPSAGGSACVAVDRRRADSGPGWACPPLDMAALAQR